MSEKIKASGDYIFTNTLEGVKFVGKFDELYKNVDDPWGQIEDEYYHQRRLDIVNTVFQLNPVNILDIGCGLGHTTQALSILITKDTTGIDISKVAVDRASKLFPGVKFIPMDVRKELTDEKYDVIILDGILWYILDDLKDVIKNVEKHLNESGYLVVAQAFIQNQRYGLDIIDGYSGLVKFLFKNSGNLKVIKTEQKDTGTRKTDSITVLQKRG